MIIWMWKYIACLVSLCIAVWLVSGAILIGDAIHDNDLINKLEKGGYGRTGTMFNSKP